MMSPYAIATLGIGRTPDLLVRLGLWPQQESGQGNGGDVVEFSAFPNPALMKRKRKDDAEALLLMGVI